ncbi:MAG TPA: YraN family protein [Firmicutes bacterium]|nr:YraN family protein [Candidatus Fermentithermobacillaceae bacterium]
MGSRRSGKKSSRELGRLVESAACAYLESEGYVILERNYTSRLGEIDIVALDGACLVFVEVRYRGQAAVESPAESLDWKKISRMKLAVHQYLAARTRDDTPVVRLDVCLACPAMAKGKGGSGTAEGRATVDVPDIGPLEFELLKGVIDFP